MIDKVHEFKGHLIIESLDMNGNLIDKFEEHNLIMDNARLAMALLGGGVGSAKPINKLVLGTNGHKEGNILVEKDGNDGFVKERTELFSEEAQGAAAWSAGTTYNIGDFVKAGGNLYEANVSSTGSNPDTLGQTDWSLSYNYPISFTPPAAANGACTVTNEPDSGSTVNRTQSGTSVTYVVNVPLTAANNLGVSIFTEAALYAGNNIFSMKTFRAKIKDDSNALRVTWIINY